MEWGDVMGLSRYWNESPPVHELVAAWVGYKPAAAPARQVAVSDIQAFHDAMLSQFASTKREAVG
jgi:hypothetical protein